MSAGVSFEVSLTKDGPFGITLSSQKVVTNIKEGGFIAKHNASNPDSQIKIGDHVVGFNGVKVGEGGVEQILNAVKEAKDGDTVVLQLEHPPATSLSTRLQQTGSNPLNAVYRLKLETGLLVMAVAFGIVVLVPKVGWFNWEYKWATAHWRVTYNMWGYSFWSKNYPEQNKSYYWQDICDADPTMDAFCEKQKCGLAFFILTLISVIVAATTLCVQAFRKSPDQQCCLKASFGCVLVALISSIIGTVVWESSIGELPAWNGYNRREYIPSPKLSTDIAPPPKKDMGFLCAMVLMLLILSSLIIEFLEIRSMRRQRCRNEAVEAKGQEQSDGGIGAEVGA